MIKKVFQRSSGCSASLAGKAGFTLLETIVMLAVLAVFALLLTGALKTHFSNVEIETTPGETVPSS